MKLLVILFILKTKHVTCDFVVIRLYKHKKHRITLFFISVVFFRSVSVLKLHITIYALKLYINARVHIKCNLLLCKLTQQTFVLMKTS